LDLNQERGVALAAELGERALFAQASVSSETDMQAAIAKCLESFGALHILINCAGIGIAQRVIGKEGPMDLAKFSRVIEINLIGTFNAIRLAGVAMIKNNSNAAGEKGVIINTASVAAFDGQIGQAAYSASKGGVVGMTLPIAREFAQHGIRV